MPEIKAFKGLLYDQEVAGDINNLAAKPYDVISPEALRKYRDMSPYNFTRLSLPLEGEGEDYYENSASRLSQWIESGILKRDDRECIYVYEQEYKTRRKEEPLKRIGMICLVKLHEFEEGIICPHEQTFSGPKEDRFKLMSAAKTQHSPIFSIYDDDEGKIDGILEEAAKGEPYFQTVDGDRTVNRIWRFSDSKKIKELCSWMPDKRLIIADGHHRYETALRYNKETGGECAAYVMMALVNSRNPGLIIDPMHRLMGGLDALAITKLEKIIKDNYEGRVVSAPGTAKDVMKQLCDEADKGRGGSTIGLYKDKTFRVLKIRDKKAYFEGHEKDHSRDWLGLNTAMVQMTILDEIYGKGAGKESGIGFEKHEIEACRLVDTGQYQAAILLSPLEMGHLKRVAFSGERLPQKSTYFYPKVESGLVMNYMR